MKQNKLRESADQSAAYFDARRNRGAETNNNQNEMKDMETMEDQSLLEPNDNNNYFEKKQKSGSKVSMKNDTSASKKEKNRFFDRGSAKKHGESEE